MSKMEREGKELQRRRLRAGRLLQRGVAQAEVARRECVTRPHRFAVERSARGWRHGGSQEPAMGSTLWARRCAAARVDEGADRRGSSGRLCHGSVDLAARGGADRTALYTFVQRDTSMAHLRVTGIFLPATLGRSAGARRQCDQALEANSSADAKKTLRNKDESSSSSTNRD